MKKQLVFVYNADSGMFNTLTDIAHKVFSPKTYSCNLCAISHSYFSERDEWKDFIGSLDADCEFLHRNEFAHKYHLNDIELPAIFELNDTDITLCLSADKINVCQSMDELKKLICDYCLQ